MYLTDKTLIIRELDLEEERQSQHIQSLLNLQEGTEVLVPQIRYNPFDSCECDVSSKSVTLMMKLVPPGWLG